MGKEVFVDPIAKFLGTWSMENNIWSILLKIGLSIILAAIIGCERSSKRHAAGLRTFIIVSLCSTLAMILDLVLMKKNTTGFWIISAAMIIGIAIISSNYHSILIEIISLIILGVSRWCSYRYRYQICNNYS